MSTGGLSVMPSNTHRTQSDGERFTFRPKRAPPPPPTVPVESRPISSESEIHPLTREISRELDGASSNDHPSLLSEFQRLFDNFDYESIREDILNRKLIQSNFTTIFWRIFLQCLPSASNRWDDAFDTNRRNYEKLRQHYTIDPYKMSNENPDGIHINHPLSRDENSLWAQYFADESLKRTILIDVQRTCPDILYFREQDVMDLQIRILFIHDRRHHLTTAYQQGMHEILGIIIYAIHTETLKINQYPDANDLMKQIYDSQYLEHDAYTLYENIMDHLRQFYVVSTTSPMIRKSISAHDAKQTPFQKLKDIHIRENETAKRLIFILDRLKHCDRVLHCKLEELKIEPTVYGIRWLRILFGREIPFDSIPKLWTVVFCFDEHFGFVDYFFIALLIEVGQSIAKQVDLTHSQYLQLFMQQNIVTNVEPVIRKALNLTGKQLSIPNEPAIILPKLDTPRVRNDSEENGKEEKVQGKIRRVNLTRTTESGWIGPVTTEPGKSASPPRTNPPENQIESQKFNSPINNVSSQTSKTNSPYIALETDMDFLTGKTSLQQYNENIQLQRSCAQYMNRFLDRLQKRVSDLNLPHEDDLQLPISGLKQIANVLDRKIPFDPDSLQAIVDFQFTEKPSE